MGNYYVAYMLRIWMTEEAGKPAWRASLESPRSGDMLYFPSLNRLFQFLECGGNSPERDVSAAPEEDTSRGDDEKGSEDS
jgi:hypothetical protein